MSDETEVFVELGTFGRAQGLRGEVRFWAHNPQSPLFRKGQQALVGKDEATLEILVVNRVRRDPKGLLVGFESSTDRSHAERLTGSKWFCRRTDFAPLEADEVYISDLVGLKVWCEAGTALGVVTDVVEVGPNLILIISTGHDEIMVPYVDAFVKSVALEEGLIRIAVLEGLLETGRA